MARLFEMNPIVAVSSWAVDRTLGMRFPDSPSLGRGPAETVSTRALPLLELPSALNAHGFNQMQLCHFHLISRDRDYADQFKAALSEANVQLLTVLIDDGDISHPDHGERDANWISGWLDTAALLGASRARVIAGRQPGTPENLARSIKRLAVLANKAKDLGLRLEIENWFDLLANAESVIHVLDELDGAVGLCLDFGNWHGAWKYEAFAQIFPRAETCHAKAEFTPDGKIDLLDYDRCLNLAKDAKFFGPFVLVTGGPASSDWDGLKISQDAIQAAFK